MLPKTLYLDEENTLLVLLDQTRLPGEEVYVRLSTLEEMHEAIKALRVRGAPAIGVAAALGLYVYIKRFADANRPGRDDLLEALARGAAYIGGARPTAVNLHWALDTMLSAAANVPANAPADALLTVLRDTAVGIYDEDIANNRLIGGYGAALLAPGMGVLTHCNAGALATAGYGTALAPVYCAREQGVQVRVYADETRPVLQGARLTAYELHAAGVDVTLLCDNMASTVMANGWVDIIFVGADRVAANGDTANKIGTHGVAILAKHFNIPFYVCAPFSTIDNSTSTGADIVIEERDSTEVTDLWYTAPMAPRGIKVYNPSFDVTPASLITAYITEKGIIRPSF